MNVMSKQLNHMLNLDLGFAQDNVLIINSAAREFSVEGVRKQAVVKQALSSVPGVAAVTFGWNLPMDSGAAVQISNPQLPDAQAVAVSTLNVDESFLDVFGMRIAQGRFFSKQFFAADSANSLVLNEFAVKALQLSDPVGSIVTGPTGQPVTVVGVVEDFNMSPLREGPDKPLAFVYVYGNQLYRHFAVKLRSSDIMRSIAQIEEIWHRVNPDVPFEFEFMDQKVQAAYGSIKDMREMARLATGVAGFVACLGLLGLAAFTAERRTQEVGIRKVLGASVAGIVRLLSKEFAILVVLATLIACPIAYFLMNKWLQGYPSRVEVTIPALLFAGAVALAVAVFTVSFQAVKAALTNPVETLRNE
jgi:putative ABC transport system permease protein